MGSGQGGFGVRGDGFGLLDRQEVGLVLLQERSAQAQYNSSDCGVRGQSQWKVKEKKELMMIKKEKAAARWRRASRL